LRRKVKRHGLRGFHGSKIRIIRAIRGLPNLPYLVLALWTALIYFRVIPHPFAYDDYSQIPRNPSIQSLAGTLNYFRNGVEFTNDFSGKSGEFYRPIFWLSLWADNAIGGPNPAGFHVTNIILHALNGILIFLIAREVFSETVALLSALVWLSLPIQSEVVAWISGRGLSLATAFILLTIIQAVRYARDRKAIRLWWVGITCSAALLSHEGGIVAPALAILVAASGSSSSTRRRTAMAVLASAGTPAAAYIFLRGLFLHLGPPALSAFHDILLRTPVSLAKYIWWTIDAPAMSVERSTELAGLQFTSPVYALAWLTLVATSLIAAYSSVPLIACSIAGALTALLPFSQILPLYQSTAERYTYTASIGILFAIVALLSVIRGRLHLPEWTPIAGLCLWIALSIVPLQHRITAWSDEHTLYTTSLRASPQSYILYHNLGVAEEDAGRSDAAIALYAKSVGMKPDYITARKDLANLYLRNKRFSEADRAYTEILQYSPEDREAQFNLANVRLAQGNLQSAIMLLRAIVSKFPDFFQAQVDLGIALFGEKDPEARTHLEAALRLKPDSFEAAYNLGVLEEEAGHIAEAIKLYRRSLFYRPGNQNAADRLRDLTANRSVAIR
jgi:tetratricopeptide (TPR) repeat protein